MENWLIEKARNIIIEAWEKVQEITPIIYNTIIKIAESIIELITNNNPEA